MLLLINKTSTIYNTTFLELGSDSELDGEAAADSIAIFHNASFGNNNIHADSHLLVQHAEPVSLSETTLIMA